MQLIQRDHLRSMSHWWSNNHLRFTDLSRSYIIYNNTSKVVMTYPNFPCPAMRRIVHHDFAFFQEGSYSFKQMQLMLLFNIYQSVSFEKTFGNSLCRKKSNIATMWHCNYSACLLLPLRHLIRGMRLRKPRLWDNYKRSAVARVNRRMFAIFCSSL